jgi:hypothetical protein
VPLQSGSKLTLYRILSGLLFAVTFLATTAGGLAQTVPVTPSAGKPALDTFDYILGTQVIGANYQFTDQSLLLEGGDAVQSMGSNMIKVSMGPNYVKAHYAKEKDPDIDSLTGLAQQKDFKALFEMPFSRYFLWASAFSTEGKVTPWHGHMKPEVLAAEYKEMFELTAYLLKTYDGTGKTFFLGNWEGDWMLLSGAPKKEKHGDEDVNPDAPQGMIDWGLVRQKAVDDAKKATPHKDVQVWYYMEENGTQKFLKQGRTSVASAVVPYVNPDFVSCSCYHSTNQDKDLNHDLPAALDFMQSRLKPKPGLPEKRVFIGEFGAPARSYNSQQQSDRIREVSAAAIKWGTPFVLYWELYNNEMSGPNQTGFWLIDDKNVKQPAYFMYQHYFADAKAFVADFSAKNKRQPTDKEFQNYAYKWLTSKH